jgi:hypothetical protein
MSVQAATLVEEEPPLTRAQRVVAKASQCLLFILCGGPIAVFPLGLAYKIWIHFYP